MTSNELSIIQSQSKKLTRAVKQTNMEEFEIAIILTNLPKLKNIYQIEKLLEKTEDSNLKLLYSLLLIKSENDKKEIERYEKALEFININEILKETEDYEFYNFFGDFSTNLKKCLKKRKIESDKKIENILSNLRKTFGNLKRNEFWRSLINVVNLIFYLYFKINQFHQSTYVFDMIEKNLDKIIKNAKSEEKLFFHFYIARLFHFKGDFGNVEEHLEKAFFLAASKKNQRKILRFLIPTKINLCIIPKRSVLADYGLEEFSDLRNAIIEGDLALYAKTLKKNKLNWIKSGVFFLLGESKALCCRNLLKRVYLMKEKPGFLDLDFLLQVFRFSFKLNNFTKEALVSLLCGLIFKDFMRGNILVAENKLIFKKNAFPEL
jgi:hypothetical protein